MHDGNGLSHINLLNSDETRIATIGFDNFDEPTKILRLEAHEFIVGVYGKYGYKQFDELGFLVMTQKF